MYSPPYKPKPTVTVHIDPVLIRQFRNLADQILGAALTGQKLEALRLGCLRRQETYARKLHKLLSRLDHKVHVPSVPDRPGRKTAEMDRDR